MMESAGAEFLRAALVFPRRTVYQVGVKKIVQTGFILCGLLTCPGFYFSAFGKDLPLALIPFKGAQAASANQILADEIKSSAFFYLAKPEPGAFVVQGRFVKKGLQGELLHPDGHRLFQRIYNSAVLKADLRQFVDDIVLAATGRPGIATSQIVFIGNKNGKPDVFVCDYDGRNIRQITRDGLPKRHPCISANGRFLFFTGMAQPRGGIYKIDLSTDQRKRIADGHGVASERAVISPDGKHLALALTEDGNSDIFISRSSGKSRRRLTDSSIAEFQPSWSADGKSLVYTAVTAAGKTQLFIVSAKNGKQPRPLAIDLPTPTQANWSPDGHRIALVSGASNKANIAVHDLRDRSTRLLGRGQSPIWGADSRHLIYTDRGALYRIDANTGKKGQVINSSAQVYDPSWTR